MSKLNGKIAVVTGGSSGIGLAAASKFVEEGAHVFIMGRRQSELDKAKAEFGKSITTVQGDVADLSDLDRLYKTVKDEKGAVDIVVASAGFVERVLTQDATPVHFDKTFGTNGRGVYFTVQKALPLIRKGGSVVLVSSGLHLKGLPEHGVYAATKAAVRSFARTWAMELKDRGIRVNTLSPGAIETPIIDGQFKPKQKPMARAPSSRAYPRSAASGVRKRWPRPFCSWLPTTAATAPVSTLSPTALSRRSERGRCGVGRRRGCRPAASDYLRAEPASQFRDHDLSADYRRSIAARFRRLEIFTTPPAGPGLAPAIDSPRRRCTLRSNKEHLSIKDSA
jgi:NAD(P)-dependent dehydrogenase (short-subunit alcohol dehydrogenase family)